MIIGLTIITAVILYIVNHKLNEVIINPSKRLIIAQIDKDMRFVKESPEKDSLRIIIRDYINGFKSINKISDESFEDFFDSLKLALKDSVIDNREYRTLSRILKRKANNERSKKN